MSETTKIQWCDSTFNPVIGCTKVSEGCANCYADRQDRFRKWTEAGWGPGKPRKRTKTWDQPATWNENHATFLALHGRRRRVFCASLSDVFDQEWPMTWRTELWGLIQECKNLDWLLLTKRPENFASYLPWDWGAGWPHVWLGVTAENQDRADERIPPLLQIPAALRFVSAEPLLGPLDLTRFMKCPKGGPNCCDNGPQVCSQCDQRRLSNNALNWIIVGGESGPGKREFDLEWGRSILRQCRDTETAFYGKQWDQARQLPHDLMVRQFPISPLKAA